ncbi:hypothetical protein [Marinomonas transparens]|uniref:hypothetical protein n=1 Tax=Marinomonas transparens TaxID=2795388 RepID=UPI001F47015B|nr:hypothetical protein [Marinomonas transparens]
MAQPGAPLQSHAPSTNSKESQPKATSHLMRRMRTECLKKAFDDCVDIVLDFVWGPIAERILAAATASSGFPADRQRCSYVVLGTIGGAAVPIAGYGLQSSGLILMGSGIGSVPAHDYVSAAKELLPAALEAGFASPHEVVPLSDIAKVWGRSRQSRYVIQPASGN